VTTSAERPPLDDLQAVAPAPHAARRTRRRRRPTGAPAPLPRHIGASGLLWVLACAVLVVWMAAVALSADARRVTNLIDAAILRSIAELRTDWLTEWMDAVDRIASGWTMTAIAVSLMLALIVFRRWRHLFTFLVSVLVLELLGQLLYHGFSRPRPFDVTIIGRWAGFSLPAAPIAVGTIIAVGIIYALVPAGRPRSIAKVALGITVVSFASAELYLATFHPSDILVGVTFAVAIPLNAFRWFTPNEVFPVKYRQGKTAHLDIGGRRGEALRHAIQEQLGYTVLDIQPVGLAGSGGSTPLLITVEGDPNTKLFGKLYAMSHVRADRWYKLGRTILYGRLEDEAPFQSVRRLVQYEDYALRFLQDVGITTAAPYGIVEITPEREYLLLTEFFDGAEEIGDAVVDDQVIDEGLLLIRRLWDVGVAHRDIKPANLLVRDGHVLVIDVAFMQIRPSAWREAVDLANMMLVLAVRTDAERVYQRALAYFSPDEIAEAFAAARGIASPSQLRTAMKRDGRDLLAQFRALAPDRQPISLQRWSFKRVGLAAGLLVAALLAIPLTVGFFEPAHDLEVSGTPSCGTGDLMILMAQAVPSAISVPCVATLPAGWDMAAIRIRRDRGTFWLDSDIGGRHAVEVNLLPPEACDTDDATEVPSDEVGMRRFEQPEQLPPDLQSTRTYLFEGGCVTYAFDFVGDSSASLMFDADSALAFQPREQLVEHVRAEDDLRLCGAGAPCPGGTAESASP
jgi:tRNA A-37 threonylcarbamoyl transferase component Bud32